MFHLPCYIGLSQIVVRPKSKYISSRLPNCYFPFP